MAAPAPQNGRQVPLILKIDQGRRVSSRALVITQPPPSMAHVLIHAHDQIRTKIPGTTTKKHR